VTPNSTIEVSDVHSAKSAFGEPGGGHHRHRVEDACADRLLALEHVLVHEPDDHRERRGRDAGVEEADLLIGCSPREEANLVGAMLVKRLSRAQTIVRTTSAAYLDAWRERHLEVDFMVSPELETANAISATLGLPAARQTDIFADGKVQIVEFDVAADAPHNKLIGRDLRSAEMPADSRWRRSSAATR
jgi:trk system potassium uptake protein TrkA